MLKSIVSAISARLSKCWRLVKFIWPREWRLPKWVLVALGLGLPVGLAIWLVPVLLLSNATDGRRDVVTFTAGLAAIVLAAIVLVRLGLETAQQRRGARDAEPGALPGPDPTTLQLAGVDLRKALLPKAELAGVELGEALLDDADLRSAAMQGSSLAGAKLRRADLRGARLGGANLSNADLHRADLRGADLRGTDLRGASLRDVALDDAWLYCAQYDKNTTQSKGMLPLNERGAICVDEESQPSST